MQWSWGLDGNHDRGASEPDQAMQQATVNLLADMGAQPASLQTGADPRATRVARRRLSAPTVDDHIAGRRRERRQRQSPVTITGTAIDTGGGVVGGVEVSVDGGATWHAAQGTRRGAYSWTPGAPGTATLQEPRGRRQRQHRDTRPASP